MTTISPSELAKENVVDIIRKLQENDILFVALKKRGPKQDGMKKYNKPFAILIQCPPSNASREALDGVSET